MLAVSKEESSKNAEAMSKKVSIRKSSEVKPSGGDVSPVRAPLLVYRKALLAIIYLALVESKRVIED